MEELGFTALNMSVAVLSLAYAPALYYLRGFNAYQNYDEDADVGGGGVIRYNTISFKMLKIFKYIQKRYLAISKPRDISFFI